jgi:hypothetical protein
MIESPAGKRAISILLAVLGVILAASSPRKPHVVYPIAAAFGLAAAYVAVRVKTWTPPRSEWPFGPAASFIAAVPIHVAEFRVWTERNGLRSPPASRTSLDEWIWKNREALGGAWPAIAAGLTATYGEALRRDNSRLRWAVRREDAVLRGPLGLKRLVLNEVHDAVYADV